MARKREPRQPTPEETAATRMMRADEIKDLIEEAAGRNEDVGIVSAVDKGLKANPSIRPFRQPKEVPTTFIRPDALHIKSKAFGDWIVHPGEAGQQKLLDETAKKRGEQEVKEAEKKAILVIKGMAILLTKTCREKPRNIVSDLLTAARQINRHPEYPSLLTDNPQATEVLFDLSEALSLAAKTNPDILGQDSYNTLYQFLVETKAIASPI